MQKILHSFHKFQMRRVGGGSFSTFFFIDRVAFEQTDSESFFLVGDRKYLQTHRSNPKTSRYHTPSSLKFPTQFLRFIWLIKFQLLLFHAWCQCIDLLPMTWKWLLNGALSFSSRTKLRTKKVIESNRSFNKQTIVHAVGLSILAASQFSRWYLRRLAVSRSIPCVPSNIARLMMKTWC